MSEEIKGFIKTMAVGLGNQYCDLYITTNRLIVAKTGSTLGWSVAFGAVGGAIAQHGAKKRAEALRELSPESILSADKKNYDISYATISKVEMKKPGMLSGGQIRIFTTSDKKHVFAIQDKKAFDDYVNLVNSVLSTKLSVE